MEMIASRGVFKILVVGGCAGAQPWNNGLDHALQTLANAGNALFEDFMTFLDNSRGPRFLTVGVRAPFSLLGSMPLIAEKRNKSYLVKHKDNRDSIKENSKDYDENNIRIY